MRCRRVTVFSFVVGALAVTSFARPFTGSFIADERPYWLAFLSVTQTEDHVRGFLTTAKPNRHGGTDSETVAVEGIADGNAVTLESKSLFNLSNVTLTGRITANTLSLSFPTNAGDVATVPFRRASEEAFNQKLISWRRELKLADDQRRRREAAAAERQQKIDDARDAEVKLVRLARELESANAEIIRRAEYQQAIAACKAAFEEMRGLEASLSEAHGEYKCSELGYRLSDARYRQEDIKYRRADLEYRINDTDRDEEELQQVRAALKAQVPIFLDAIKQDPTGKIPPRQAAEVAGVIQALLEQTSKVLAQVHAVNDQARKACDAEIANAVRLYEHFGTVVKQQGCNKER